MSDFDEWWNDEQKPPEQLKQECSLLLDNSCYDSESKYSIEQQLWYYSEEELNKLKRL